LAQLIVAGVIQRWYQCDGPLEEVVVEDAVEALEDIMKDIRRLDLIPLRGVGMLELGYGEHTRSCFISGLTLP
jgi:hypothetical protein